ncbi:MAG TPA: ATP-binding protein [Trebonia sp.]|jgi:anti-sigma regulatory factor (Ser/Thr protein kinase)|nr:ATP-binding protein [Trebonia sp.]
MNALASTSAIELHQRRVRLPRTPVSAGVARGHLRAAIAEWRVPVDADVAVLLTSDLVTNAILHGDGKTVTVAIRCSRGRLRVDVYDTARSLPATLEPADMETGSGLVLLTTLASEWGCFRTPAGKAVYFTLEFAHELPPGTDEDPPGITRGVGGL